MTPGEFRKYRLFWRAVMALFLVLGALVFYVIELPADGLPAGEDSPGTDFVAWGLGILGMLLSVAGARLARAVFQKDDTSGNGGIPDQVRYLIGLGLIEATAVLAVVLYIRTGVFYTYILLSGIALLGWAVARPEQITLPEDNGTPKDDPRE